MNKAAMKLQGSLVLILAQLHSEMTLPMCLGFMLAQVILWVSLPGILTT
jgi:hypothetical protein